MIKAKLELDEEASESISMYRYVFRTEDGPEGCIWIPKQEGDTLKDAPKPVVIIDNFE